MKAKTTSKGFYPFQILKKNHPFNSFLSIVLALAVINLSISCSYYKVKDLTTSQEVFEKKLNDFNQIGHYAILHSGDELYHLDNISIDQERNILNGTVNALSVQHVYKKERSEKHSNRFKPKKQDPISEIHITLKDDISPVIGTNIEISLSDIYSVSINKRDSLLEFATVILGVAGVIGGVFLIILATKSSCPFVYVKVGDTYQFAGELYPGILTENMQIDDYLPLGNYQGTKQNYSIKVTNELKEIQHTDLLELIVIDHPNEIKVLLDDKGNLQTFSNLYSPTNVLIDDVKQDMATLKNIDGDFYAFNSTSELDDNIRNTILEFDTPDTFFDTKLLITAKNSMWLDYIFGKFNQQFGSYYQEFQAQQQTKTKEQSEKWINEQHIPLNVYVETVKGWELIKRINTVGPLAFRDIVVPINSKYITKDKLKVKLETGFMFWEVDYVGINYSENIPLNVNYIAPYEAIDQNNQVVTKLLTTEDNVYFTQSEIGEEVTVNFNLKNVSISSSHSVFLKNKGYYNYIRDFKGEPNLEALKIFRKEGSFTDFSMLEYYAIMGIENSEYLTMNE